MTFQTTLQSAISQQESRMSADFADVKKLLMSMSAQPVKQKRTAENLENSEMQD